MIKPSLSIAGEDEPVSEETGTSASTEATFSEECVMEASASVEASASMGAKDSAPTEAESSQVLSKRGFCLERCSPEGEW